MSEKGDEKLNRQMRMVRIVKNENLTDCYCEQESSCGFVARRENTHRVDDRNDPVLIVDK